MATIFDYTGTTATLERPEGMTTILGRDARDLIFTREFDAPRENVFRAWTEAALLEQWWGMPGYKGRACKVNLQRGGGFSMIIRTQSGTDFVSKGVYLEIEENQRLVMRFDTADHPAEWIDAFNRRRDNPDDDLPIIIMTATFEDTAGGTRLTLNSRFETAEYRDLILKMGASEGWEQSLDRLEAAISRN